MEEARIFQAHAYTHHSLFLSLSLTLSLVQEKHIYKRVCHANRRHEVNENVGTPSQVLPTASKQNSQKCAALAPWAPKLNNTLNSLSTYKQIRSTETLTSASQSIRFVLIYLYFVVWYTTCNVISCTYGDVVN